MYPDERLKQVAELVDFEGTSEQERVDIVQKLNTALGGTKFGQRLGMAATQIGINKRVIIVKGNVLFNPVFIPTQAPKDTITESCYSVPRRFFKVERAPYGWVEWTSLSGEKRKARVKGLNAIILQHEIDHLEGKCCIDTGVEVTDDVLSKAIEQIPPNGEVTE